jgi:uncharacterized protein (DUF924 family)
MVLRMMDKHIQQVLDFWFAPEGDPMHLQSRPEWFRKDDAFDAAIRSTFGSLIEDALAGRLDHWASSRAGAVARIVVLDQFTRNTFRNTARAFAGDAQALAAARSLVASGDDRVLPGVHRMFVYLPFEHAEDMAMQDECVRLMQRLAADETRFADLVTFAEKHRVIVQRFGRFPHRNASLGRASTPDELAFLEQPGSGF